MYDEYVVPLLQAATTGDTLADEAVRAFFRFLRFVELRGLGGEFDLGEGTDFDTNRAWRIQERIEFLGGVLWARQYFERTSWGVLTGKFAFDLYHAPKDVA